MDVNRCCLPWSVQHSAGDNPQGLCECVWVCECVCVCVCVCECRAPSSSSCHVYFCIVCFGFPLCCAFHPWTARQSGALCGLKRVRKRERWGHQEGVKTDRKRGEDESFERLLTSKSTVMAALAGGESTSKHTRWAMKWSDCTSRVIRHVLTVQTQEISGEKWTNTCAWKVNKGLAQIGLISLRWGPLHYAGFKSH